MTTTEAVTAETTETEAAAPHLAPQEVVSAEAAPARPHMPEPIEINKPPSEALRGYLTAHVEDNEGVAPTSIIDIKHHWVIRFHWWLEGKLARCLCGYWCLEARFESIGPGPEFTSSTLLGKTPTIPLDPCGDFHYWYGMWFPPHKVKTRHCGIDYKVTASVRYHVPCKDAQGRWEPGPMYGVKDLGLLSFYESH